MQRSNWVKILGVGVLTLSTAVLPATLPASAQVNQPGTGTERTVNYDNNSFDWGWLGLLGLIGLAGLAGKNRHNDSPTAYRDPDPVSRGGTYRE
jgi:hypothetical protein